MLTGAFLVVCATGGENIHWGYLGFEWIFPFYLSVVVGEWCKIRTDPMFEVIAAQGKSLFHWIVRRFLIPFWIGEHFCPCWNGLRYIPKSQYVFRGLSDNFLPDSICSVQSVCPYLRYHKRTAYTFHDCRDTLAVFCYVYKFAAN